MPPFTLPVRDANPHLVSSSRVNLQTLNELAIEQRNRAIGLSPVDSGPRDVSSRFGRKLKQLRVSRAMTQVDMAKKFGIDRSFISDVERGRKSISLPMLEVIALGMKISLSKLLEDL